MAQSTVDPQVARQQRRRSRPPWPVLAVISAGGVLGALGRYGLATAWPHAPGHFPWATFVTNVSGCLLIGVLMVLVTEVLSAHRPIRPFLGVGVLGGYTTTYSTFGFETVRPLEERVRTYAVLNVVAGIVAGLGAAYCGIAVAEALCG